MSREGDTAAPRPGRMTADQRRLLERLLAEGLPAPERSRIRPDAADRSHAELSSAQRRIWYFDQLQPGSPLYIITGVARLRGRLDIPVLRRCFDEVLRRHEALRTTFHGDGVDTWCRAGGPAPVPMELTDLSDLPAADRDRAVRERLDAEAVRPFDLSRDLMLRAALVRVAPDEHLLQLCMHHIAADGWSLGVLLRELGVLYTAYRSGKPSPLPELTVQYSDYAVWQRTSMSEPAHEELLRNWIEGLRDASALDLPTDRPRRGSNSFAGGCVPFELPAEVTGRIRRLADQERATPFMVLFAALALLLGRWSGQPEDVVVGCAVAGRNRSEIEPLIGFFVNTLPLRLDLSGAPSFRTVVRRARAASLDGYAWQDVPFEQIVERLHPDREPDARVPLVRHMLVLHNSPRPRLRLPELDVEVLPLETGTAKFELQLELTPTPDGRLTGWMEYSRDLFDEATVVRLMEGLRLLLADGLDRPDTPADELRILADTDRADVVEGWSGAAVAPAGHGLLHELFERTADAMPDAVAVVHGETAVSYAELEARANRMAGHLIARGVGVEDVVGVCLPRSPEAIAAMLGVLKAGAAYLPLDPADPPRRVAELAGAAGARLVIRADDADPAGSAVRPAVGVRPGNSAYVLYTSGSTGRPKGAVNEHGAVANRILWMQESYGLTRGETVLHKTPLGFDVSGWEWLWPLAVGARVLVADADGRRDPAVIAGLIRNHTVTTCHFVPSMLRVFLADRAAGRCAGVLRRVICSGEELPPETARRFRDVLPGTELHNLYGPTEAAIDVTAWAVPDGVPDDLARLPIGFPISGARLYVVDDRMNPVPPGVPGELLIGGLPVCRGYRGRPGLTAERFVPDPFEPGARLYRTGDRARWSAGGALDFLGRLDFQVKVRGQRIEPGEIEAALATHPAVDRAVVVPYRDGSGNLQLAAYAGLKAGGAGLEPVETTEHVDHWRVAFDETYRGSDPDDASFDIAGWTDSYTGEPLPEAEMREWVGETVSRIAALGPSRVLEIGCGTGLLLLRLAPRCAYYCGTDISAEAIARLRSQADGDAAVELAQRPAEDFTGLAEGGFDTVILNSVVQYFPDADHLVGVLRKAMRLLRPGGNLFVGDVRDLRTIEAFHCSVLLDRLPPGTPVEVLRRLVDRQVAREEELVVHPALFEQIAGPGRSAILAKSSPHRNELTRFRYDVIITVPGADPGATAPGAWIPWTPEGPARPAGGGSYGLLGMPDARVHGDLLAVRLMRGGGMTTVGELRHALAETPEPAAVSEPAALTAPEGYRVMPRLGAEAGLLDPEFREDGRPAPGHPAMRPPADGVLAGDPRQAARQRVAVAALRDHAQRTLPGFMVPATFTVLSQWPVGPNGKLDRKALPPPEYLRPVVATGYVAPRTGTERAVARVWRDVLHLDRIGVHDDFFALGGHSLLAVQLAGRIQARFGRELSLGALLRSPTIAAVAAQLEASGPEPSRIAPIGRTERRRRDSGPASANHQGASA